MKKMRLSICAALLLGGLPGIGFAADEDYSAWRGWMPDGTLDSGLKSNSLTGLTGQQFDHAEDRARLGVRYRFLFRPSRYEWDVRMDNFERREHATSAGEATRHTEVGLHGKLQLSPRYALLIDQGYHWANRDNERLAEAHRFLLGTSVLVSPRLALDLRAGYADAPHLRDSSTQLFRSTLTYGVNENLNLVLEGSYSDLEDNEEALWLDENHPNLWSIRVNWRF